MSILGVIASQLASGAGGGGPPPSIDAVIAVTEFTAPTSIGTKDITTSALGGRTPKAAMFLVTNNNAADSPSTAHAIQMIGFTDGVESFACCARAQSALASMLARREATSSYCIMVQHSTNSTTYNSRAAFDSFITNGIRVNFSTVDASFPKKMICILFAGDDMLVDVGVQNLGNGTSALDITAPGFEPDLVFGASANVAIAAGNSTRYSQTFGIATNDGVGGIVQKGVAYHARNLHQEDIEQIIWTGRVGGNLGGIGDGTIVYTLTLSAFDANGFSITPSADSSGQDWGYLAVNLGGLQASLFDFSTATSTGVVSYETPAFTPQFGMAIATFLQARDTAYFDNLDLMSLGIAAFDGTEQWVSWSRQEYVAAGNSDCLSVVGTYSLAAWDPNDAGVGTGVAATLSSFDSLGFNLNYTLVDGTARMAFGLAIEAP